MENKFLAVQEKIEYVESILDSAKHFVGEADIASATDEAFAATKALNKVLTALEDLEMEQVDFKGIDLDSAFEGNPVSEYVQAGIDYVAGDETAKNRMIEAASRITGAQVVTSEEGATNLLNDILDREEAFAVQLEKDLESIERVLEGTKIDNWTEEQIELARFFIQFQSDTTLNEVELLTPHGVKMVWKRRRYLGAAK